jgi:PAS domain S-box-containing protein
MPRSDVSLFDELLDNATDNIYIIDHDGRYTHVSRGGAAAIGSTPEQVVGRTWRDLGLPAVLMDEVEAQWSRVFVTGENIKHQVSYEGRSFEYSMFPLGDHVGVVARDITDQVRTEEELRRAAERYRAFVVNSSEGIWRFELDSPVDTNAPEDEQIQQIFDRGYLAECNDAMARMYGFERAEDLIGTRLRDVLDRNQLKNREFLRAFIGGGYRLVDAESIETDRHGKTRHFVNSFVGVIDGSVLLRSWGTQRDVTEHRLSSERLRSSERRLQALVAATAQIVWTADPEGRLTWIAASWTELTGQPADSPMGIGWFDLIHPDDRADAEAKWRRAYETRTIYDNVARLRVRDGSYRWMRARNAPVLNDDGSIHEWIGAMFDIDAERRQADAQGAQRRRAEFIADANDLFVRSLDYEQTLRNLARLAVPRLGDWCAVDMLEPDGTFRRLVVEHPDPQMMKFAFEIQEKYPEDPSSPYGTHEVARTGKTSWLAEIPEELIAANARSPEHLELIRKLRLRAYISAPILVRDRVGGVLTLVSSSRNYTDADVALAEDLALRAGHAIENARLYEQAIQANRTKDEFLATLSHELRTPLTAILGWANLLHISNYDAQTVRTAVDTIEQSARAQAALIDDLLDISRVVTGKLKLDIEPMDMVPVVESGIAAVRPAAEAKRITIHVDAPSPVNLRGDANRIQQIVWNLMSNAVKFSAEGTRIDVSVARVGQQAVIRIADQGIGIERELLPHVFERFWQADSTSHRSHGGLGLGLAIVKYLTELHGGTVSAESEGKDRGTAFTVSLPIGAPQEAAEETAHTKPVRGTRVLLVDDDATARDVLRRTLEHFGAKVTAASSAAEAIGLIGQNAFDLVLTDIAMPQNDGYWLLSEVRRINPRLRVAAITALGHSDEQIAGAGFDSFLRKPLEPERLAEILDRFSA